MASEKQIRYILYLMSKKGFSTKWMNSEHKALGATMRERSGSVSDWLTRMDSATASTLIDQLKS